MADYARLDEELDALGAGLDIDAILATVPKSDGLEAADAELAALGENVSPPKRRSFMPPKMSEDEARAMAMDAQADPASSLSNFHAGLTPSDLQELAEIEAAEAALSTDNSAVSIPPLSPPPAEATAVADLVFAEEAMNESEPIAPESMAPESMAPESMAPESMAPAVAPPSAPPAASVPPQPIFKAEDLAAIRASSPPPPGADAGAEVEVDLEDLEELEIDELDFVEFEEGELEELGLSESESSEQVEANDPTEQVITEQASAPVEAPADAAEAPNEGNEEGEKKGFFKKIFG